MNFFKNTLAFVVLLASCSLFARDVRPKGSAVNTQQPAQVKKTGTVSGPVFADLFIKVKGMSALQVVSGNTLNPAFVKSIVENINLSNSEVKALLQTGVNVHAIWSGNDEQDKKKLLLLNDEITEAYNNALRQQVKILPQELGQKRLVNNMDDSNLDINYITPIASDIVEKKGFAVKGESQKGRINRLVGLTKNELINRLKPEWDQNKLEDLKTLINKTLHNQIVNTVEQEITIAQELEPSPFIGKGLTRTVRPK